MKNEIQRAKILIKRINDFSFMLNEYCKSDNYKATEDSHLTSATEYLYKNTDELYAFFNSLPEDTKLPSDFYRF